MCIWYLSGDSGDCWRRGGLKKYWEALGGSAQGWTAAAGLPEQVELHATECYVLGHKRICPWEAPGRTLLIHPEPVKGNLSFECVMQANGIALVALGSRFSSESLRYSRCLISTGRLGFEVACHGATMPPSRAGLPSYSFCATGRETAREAGHSQHV